MIGLWCVAAVGAGTVEKFAEKPNEAAMEDFMKGSRHSCDQLPYEVCLLQPFTSTAYTLPLKLYDEPDPSYRYEGGCFGGLNER